MLPAAGRTWLRYPLDIFSDRRLGRRGRWIPPSMTIGAVSGIGAIYPEVFYGFRDRLLASRQVDNVTVVSSHHDLQVIGTFSRRELILAYGEAMDRLRETEGDVADGEPF